MLATIPLDLIEDGQRLRDLSEATVVALVNSISDVGLLNPITVYPRKLFRGGNQVDGYGLVAGLHRKVACERLGLAEIEANVVDLDDLDRQIAECDENLCGTQLSPSDRARFTKRRKDAYEAKHPEAKAGAIRARAANEAMGHDVDDNVSPAFTSDTAEKTGKDMRTVQRDASRGEKISAAALAKVKNTDLDTGKYLDTLKALPVTEQIKKVQADLKRPPARKIVRVADAPLDDDDARERQVAALMSAWNKASAEARQEFLARIDAPVFDRSAA